MTNFRTSLFWYENYIFYLATEGGIDKMLLWSAFRFTLCLKLSLLFKKNFKFTFVDNLKIEIRTQKTETRKIDINRKFKLACHSPHCSQVQHVVNLDQTWNAGCRALTQITRTLSIVFDKQASQYLSSCKESGSVFTNVLTQLSNKNKKVKMNILY